MKDVTLKDIRISAVAAAQKALAATDALQVQEIKHEAFTASGFERMDFSMWESQFQIELDALRFLSTQKSLATMEAIKAAAAKGAK